MSHALPNRRKYVIFATMAAMGSVLIAGFVVVALDLYLHQRLQSSAGLNAWGFRGPTLTRKEPGETRVAVLGGSSAFGYGVTWDQAFPHRLEQELAGGGSGRFTVANLAYNNEGAYSFRYTLEDFESLDYDVVILYEGYNDLGEPNYQVFRRESPVFRLTGYFPILPLVLMEKTQAILYGGDLESAYRGDRAVFRPTIAQRATVAVLQTASATAESLTRQVGRLTRDLSDAHVVTPNAGCGDRWRHYCGAMYDAIRWALDRDKTVLVGGQPYVSDSHIDQQNALVGMLQERFSKEPRVRYVNLGRVVSLSDRGLSFDGMHLTPPGNARVAEQFVAPVLEMTRQ